MVKKIGVYLSGYLIACLVATMVAVTLILFGSEYFDYPFNSVLYGKNLMMLLFLIYIIALIMVLLFSWPGYILTMLIIYKTKTQHWKAYVAYGLGTAILAQTCYAILMIIEGSANLPLYIFVSSCIGGMAGGYVCYLWQNYWSKKLNRFVIVPE